MAAMLAQTIYNMTDMFFIGQTKDLKYGRRDFAGAPVVYAFTSFGQCFSTADPAISRECRAKNGDEAAHICRSLTPFSRGDPLTAISAGAEDPVSLPYRSE